MQAILEFLNQPIVKMLFVMAGTFILRKWPRFVNEAVPFWTGLYSVGTTGLGMLFPGHVPTVIGAHAASFAGFVVASAGHGSWWQSLLFDGIFPWLLGYGGQRAGDHTIAWATGGATVETEATIKRGHEKPIAPFKTLVK